LKTRMLSALFLMSTFVGCGKSPFEETVYLDYTSRQLDSTLQNQLRKEWLRKYRLNAIQRDQLRPVQVSFRIWLDSPLSSLEGLTPLDSTMVSCLVADSSYKFETPAQAPWVVELTLNMKEIPKLVTFNLESVTGQVSVNCMPRPGDSSRPATLYSNEWKEFTVAEAGKLIQTIPDRKGVKAVSFRTQVLKGKFSVTPGYLMGFFRVGEDGINACIAY